MRIVCPNCAAEYEVPASRLTPQRMVRCARCNGKWSPVRDAEQAAPAEPEPSPPADPRGDPPAPLPPVTAMDRLAASAVQPPLRSAGLTTAWVMSCLVLLTTVAATITWREKVVVAWPASSRILGPAPNTAPLKPGEIPANENPAHAAEPVQATKK